MKLIRKKGDTPMTFAEGTAAVLRGKGLLVMVNDCGYTQFVVRLVGQGFGVTSGTAWGSTWVTPDAMVGSIERGAHDLCDFYYFPTLVEFAHEVIKNGWKLP